MDLSKLTAQELKNLLVNARRLEQRAMVHSVLAEMHRRGIAKNADYEVLEWNQDHVRQKMQPFKEIAATVKGNERTSYTEAGGFKIGRAKDHPERMWIDTYSAIKTSKLNAIFVCYVKSPGDDPEFHLYSKRGPLAASPGEPKIYSADQLADALNEWTRLAGQA